MARSITSANASLVVTVPRFFPVPFVVQGFATDDAFATEMIDASETQMGVDGQMAAGYVPAIVPVTISLQANSESADFFENWNQAQALAKDVFFAELILTLPGLGKTYALHKGALRRVKGFPDGKRVLQPVQYQIDFESYVAAPLAAA